MEKIKLLPIVLPMIMVLIVFAIIGAGGGHAKMGLSGWDLAMVLSVALFAYGVRNTGAKYWNRKTFKSFAIRLAIMAAVVMIFSRDILGGITTGIVFAVVMLAFDMIEDRLFAGRALRKK
jgi:hypothetical protein